MWCPKCKNEYREGITVCADCGIPLVEALPEDQEENEIEETSIPVVEEVESMEDLYETEDEVLPGISGMPREHHEIYQDSEQKANDNKSSGYALLFVGLIGVVGICLLFMDKLPYHLYGSSKYLICGVMGVLFLLFVIMGIVSMRSFKALTIKAASENSLKEEIHTFCVNNLSGKQIDEALAIKEDGDTPVEELYFKRIQYIKDRINEQYLNLDHAFLDHFADEYYDEQYENLEDTHSENDDEEEQ